MDHRDIEPSRYSARVHCKMEVASTSMREAPKTLEDSLLEGCCGYQDISAQTDLCPYLVGSGSRRSATEI